MAMVLSLLALTFLGVAAYAMALERLFHLVLEQRESEDTKLSRHRQHLVVLRVCIGKLNLAFALGLAVYSIAERHAGWQVAALLVLLCLLGGRLLSSVWLQPHTLYMLAALGMELERQRTGYHRRGKTVQEQAVEGLLARVAGLTHDLLCPRPRR